MTLDRICLPVVVFATALSHATVAAAQSADSVEAASDADSARTPTRGAEFDFQDADLRVVISALAEAGGLSVTYSALPQRPVTLRTNGPVPSSEIESLLRIVASANGLEVTREGALLHVQPAPQQRQTHGNAPGNPAQQQDGELRLFVYHVRHVEAVRLAGTLQALFGGSVGVATGAGLSRAGLSMELRGQRIPEGIPDLVQPRDALVDAQGLPGDVRGEVQIVPDELTNSILVRASEADWQVIERAIAALDLRPLQVLIEVLIAEIRTSSNENLGVSAEVPLQRDTETGALIGGSLTGPSAGDFVLEILDAGPIRAELVLRALSTRSDVTILSRPVVLAQNNQEARILVGSERPFVQVFRALPTDAAVRDQVVQYRDVGTSLTIRPTINHDGYVSLQLVQEVSTATNETQFGAPVISTREAATRLLVRDGQTVVIGGLIDRQRDRTRGGIPLLKDLPLIGWLFGSRGRADIQTELFLFLTPHIIDSDEDASRLRQGVEEGTELLERRLPPHSIIPDSLRDPAVQP